MLGRKRNKDLVKNLNVHAYKFGTGLKAVSPTHTPAALPGTLGQGCLGECQDVNPARPNSLTTCPGNLRCAYPL